MKPNRFIRIFGLILGIALVSSCGKEKTEKPVSSAAEISEAEDRAKRVIVEHEERDAKIQADLLVAKPEDIRRLLRECRQFVIQRTKVDYRTPFEPFIPDQYSADVYKGAAFMADTGYLDSDADRLKRFLDARKRKEKVLQYSLTLSHPVVVTRESLTEMVKEVKRVSCSLRPGLQLDTVL